MDQNLKKIIWMYSALGGVCATFFLALLSSNIKLSESCFLWLSSLCFGILLPIFIAFFSGLLVCEEKGFGSEAISEILERKWTTRVADLSQKLLVLAFILLLCHFSIFIGISMFGVTIIMFLMTRRFLFLVKGWDQTLKRIKEEENKPDPN
jgi:hypothetical protein